MWWFGINITVVIVRLWSLGIGMPELVNVTPSCAFAYAYVFGTVVRLESVLPSHSGR